MIITKTKKELQDVLMDAKAPGVKEAYYTIVGDGQNITAINPGKNGTEFNKTFGNFHKYQGVIIYQCLSGQGIIVVQRNNEEGQAKEFKVATLSSGKQVEIPAGFGHCIYNIGKGYLVVLDNGPKGDKYYDEAPVIEKQGLAYYIVEKKGEVGFEENDHYTLHPQISTEV